MSASSEPPKARVEIEFVLGRDPIRGLIRDSGGSASAFSGWLELLGALERIGGPTTAWESDFSRRWEG